MKIQISWEALKEGDLVAEVGDRKVLGTYSKWSTFKEEYKVSKPYEFYRDESEDYIYIRLWGIEISINPGGRMLITESPLMPKLEPLLDDSELLLLRFHQKFGYGRVDGCFFANTIEYKYLQLRQFLDLGEVLGRWSEVVVDLSRVEVVLSGEEAAAAFALFKTKTISGYNLVQLLQEYDGY